MKTVRLAILGLAMSIFVAACGGGGGVVLSTVSGLAAAGLPIVGVVNVKGANGGTASSTINPDGTYSVNVDALTAPFVLFAQGTSGGVNVRFYSTIESAGQVNVTPLTDLVLANATGGAAADAFTNWMTVAPTVDPLDVAAAALRVAAQIQPVLDALGVGAADFMNGSFSANGTGLDAVLDVLTVKIDAANGMVTITNTFTGSSFTDALGTTPTPGASLPTGDTTTLSGTVTALAQIRAISQLVTDMAADGVQTAQEVANLAPFLSDIGFLNSGETKTELLNNIQADPLPLGLTMVCALDTPMTATEYAPHDDGVWALCDFGLPGEPVERGAFVLDGTSWTYRGNGNWLRTSIQPRLFNRVFSGTTGTIQSTLTLFLEDDNNYARNQGVNSAIITGPGLAAAGVKLAMPAVDTVLEVFGELGKFSFGYPLTDTQILSIPESAGYTVRLFAQTAATVNGAVDTPVHTIQTHIFKRPLTSTEAAAAAFPVLQGINDHFTATANLGGSFTLNWDLPQGLTHAETFYSWFSAGLAFEGDIFANGAPIAGPRSDNHLFDTSSVTLTPDLVIVSVEGIDPVSGHALRSEWHFNDTTTPPVPGTVVLGGKTFDGTSDVLTGHPLAIDDSSSWILTGYNGTTEVETFSFVSKVVRGVDAVELTLQGTTSVANGGFILVGALARATDGAIYFISFTETDDLVTITMRSDAAPLLFLPASVAPGTSWTTGISLLEGETCTSTVVGNNATSPGGLTGTTHIRELCNPASANEFDWNMHWKAGRIVDEYDTIITPGESFRTVSGNTGGNGTVVLGGKTFDSTSATLSAHPLALDTSASWVLNGYVGTTETETFSFTNAVVRGVNVVELTIRGTTPVANGGFEAVGGLARATDGAIYLLSFSETDAGVTQALAANAPPALFLGANMTIGATWSSGLAVLDGDTCTNTVVGTNVTSPGGIVGTLHTRELCNAGTNNEFDWNMHWKNGRLVDEYDTVPSASEGFHS